MGGDVYLHGSKCSSVHLHDGAAVAKGRDTPSPFFVTCGGHKVKSTTMGLTDSQQCSKGGSVYISHTMYGGSLHLSWLESILRHQAFVKALRLERVRRAASIPPCALGYSQLPTEEQQNCE